MGQATFQFEPDHDYTPENFLVSESNRLAYESATAFPWAGYALNIHGPKGSGKTYLANILNNLAGDSAVIIEDVSAEMDEQLLLHTLNQVKEEGKHILLTSATPLNSLGFKLPDLTSRLAAVNSVALREPDNQLFYMLFARHFNARQLKVSDEVLSFLASRVERSFEKAAEAVERIDKLSLAEKRNITIPLVKDAI